MSQPQAAYVHIPFCRRRCFYCDFPIKVVGDRRDGSNSGMIQQYLVQLIDEIRHTRLSKLCRPGLPPSPTPFSPGSRGVECTNFLVPPLPEERGLGGEGKPLIKPLIKSTSDESLPPLATVFLGGGTPSLLTAGQIAHLLEGLAQTFGLTEGAEISIEMDPATFTLAQVQDYLAAGINRISLGAQAFQDPLLAACGRTHRVEDITEAVDLVRRAGCTNLSLDLISGLPDQTLADWTESLEQAIALTPEHLSAYDLVLEPGTVFAKRFSVEQEPLPTQESAAQMYRMAQQMLTAAGWQHYEISNYARPGYACRHNRVYWLNQPYYGFGMGAASFVGGRRWTRPRTTATYGGWVDQVRQGTWDWTIVPEVSETDALLETLMLGLRLSEGVNVGAIAAQFGPQVVDKLRRSLHPYLTQGLVHWEPVTEASASSASSASSRVSAPQSAWTHAETQGQLRLHDPDGFLLSNQILARLFAALGDNDEGTWIDAVES